ncbi:MAG: type II toxin-antitoxin system ParD family antitoxin [Terracidiphilus sp.]|jgi:antitoxin ParD1/3/4
MMFHRGLQLTPDSHEFIRTRVESGRYENANELVRAALRALQREESTSESPQKANAIADGDVFRKLWEISGETAQIQR